jgi:hypothetical protein
MSPVSRLLFAFACTLQFAIPICANGQTHSEQNTPIPAFRWIDSQRDRVVWDKIKSAFGDELKPDEPDPDTLTYGFKYLNRVGVFNNSAIVIVGYRTKEHFNGDEYVGEHCLAFNYDLATGAVSKVIDPAGTDALYMWRWNFVKLARFEPTPLPDVVFTYLTCSECEPEKMLAALHYDPSNREWQIRQWGDGNLQWWMSRVGLVVQIDRSFTSDLSYDCLYGFLSLNHDGLEDVAIRCREVSEDEKGKRHVDDATALFSFKGKNFTGQLVTAKDQQLTLWSELCQVGYQKKLCKSIENSGKPQAPAGTTH